MKIAASERKISSSKSFFKNDLTEIYYSKFFPESKRIFVSKEEEEA